MSVDYSPGVPPEGKGFGAETSQDWFECLSDEPDFAAMTGLARGICWSDVLGEIQADNQRRTAAGVTP